MSEHIINVAFEVEGRDRHEACTSLMNALPDPADGVVEAWWVAEDDRHDGSDNYSAVFVSPGNQRVAAQLMYAAGLTPKCNLVDPVGGQFGTPDRASNPTLQEVKERLLEWMATPPGEKCANCGDAVTREGSELVGSDGETTCPFVMSARPHGPAVPDVEED